MSPTRKRKRAGDEDPLRRWGSHLQDYDIKEGKAPRATNDKSRSSAKSRKKAPPRLSLPPQTDALHQLLSIISVEQNIDETLSRQDDEGDLEASDDSDADDSDANDSDADDQSATVDDAAGERLNEQTIDCSMLRNVLDEAVVKYSQEILGLDSRQAAATRPNLTGNTLLPRRVGDHVSGINSAKKILVGNPQRPTTTPDLETHEAQDQGKQKTKRNQPLYCYQQLADPSVGPVRVTILSIFPFTEGQHGNYLMHLQFFLMLAESIDMVMVGSLSPARNPMADLYAARGLNRALPLKQGGKPFGAHPLSFLCSQAEMRTIIAVSQNSATSIYNIESARKGVNYELIARLMRDQGVDKSVDDVKRIYKHLERRSNTGFVSLRVHKFTEYWKELSFFKQHLNQNGLIKQPRNEHDTFFHIPALEDGQETSANVKNLLIRSGYTRQGPAWRACAQALELGCVSNLAHSTVHCVSNCATRKLFKLVLVTNDISMAPNTSTAKSRRQLPGEARGDSDDELANDELPWEWIYNSTPTAERSDEPQNDRKRRKVTGDRIVGARAGQFECGIGDIVMLKADGSNEAWVALICEFVEDDGEGEKAANFMWFSSEKEIRNRDKKRSDYYWCFPANPTRLQNELYISPSWDINPLASINGKAKVTSLDAFLARHPQGRIPRNRPDYGKTFVCRRGCNTRTATYTDEFVWEEVYRGEDDLFSMMDMIKNGTKATRRRRKARSPSPTEAAYHPPQTPTKTGRGSTVPTPTSRRSQAEPGSRTKRSTSKRLEFTPLATRKLSPSRIESSPFQIARSRLHVSSVPTSLPCREGEFSLVYSHLEAAISDGTGNCIYISGTPGTGKTATVREVISRLEEAVGSDELDDFIFVEINGMKITDPHQSYTLLWEALKGQRASPAQALDLLEREFSNPSPRRIPCVVLMDELDQLVTKNQAVMYNFFNWPTLRHSRLIVLAVANTMDLPERTLSNKISSRLGLTRITFPGYNHEQLMKIIQSRLEGVSGNIVDPDAIQFASRKVAAVSGDARRALDICRRAVELAEADVPGDPTTPSKSQGQPRGAGRVTIATIKKAINEATTNPIQQHLRSLPLMSKLLMAAVLLRIRRTGLAETTFGETLDEIHRASLRAPPALPGVVAALNNGPKGTQAGGQRPMTRPGHIHTAALELVAAGLINLEAQRAERSSKLRLSIADDEVKMALRDDGELKALGIGV
ncbi:hypothetical protein ACJZ2D_008400 [Fusarium nematophilum]